MLGNIFTEIARDTWTNTPGNSMALTWTDGNPTAITYLQGDTVVFVKSYTYDADGNPTLISCSKPTQNN